MLKDLLNTSDIIEIPGTPIKIHVQALEPEIEVQLEAIRYLPENEDPKRRLRNAILYQQEYIRHSVKKVEGFEFNKVPYVCEFEPGLDKLSMQSYVVIDLLFSKKLKVDFFKMIIDFNKRIEDEVCDGFTFTDDSKKKEN